MSDHIGIDLPNDLSEAQQDEFIASLRQVDGVAVAVNLGPSRSGELETISVGVQIATQIAGLIGPVVKKILEAIAGHQIKGVRLSLPDGTSVAVDQISARDLDHLLARLDKSLDGADGHGNVE